MRVTHLGAFQANVDRVNGRLEAFVSTQNQLATGKRMSRPSDDVLGMGRALELRASLKTREQEQRNAADGEMWVNLADARLQSVVSQLQRAREIAIAGASSTGADQREAIRREVVGIRDAIVELANTRHQGRGLFAGYSQADAVQNVGGVWTYQGDDGAVRRRIGEQELVTVNVTGDDAFGFTSGRDVFSVLDDLDAALAAGDTAAIEAAIADVDGSLDTVIDSLTRLGIAGSRIEQARLRVDAEVGVIKNHLSSIEDVDIAEAVMELQMQETAYQSALAAFARSTQSSLVDFLR